MSTTIDESPWHGILASTKFALRATVHTPAQLVFGPDSMLNTCRKANWQLIKKRKQDLINKGNQRENRDQKGHTYNKREKICGRVNSTKIHTLAPMQSQLSETMALLGHVKVK